MDIKIQTISGSDITKWIEKIADLRIEIFKSFPYLYDGDHDYERKYLSRYVETKNSMIALATVDDKLIGASTCLPLSDEDNDFKKPFLDQNFDINKIFYFGESIILSDYRGHKTGHRFFETRENHAKTTMPNLEYTCFCAVNRPMDHLLRPKNYRPLDDFWTRLNYIKHENLYAEFPWKDVDKEVEDRKKLTFWLKKWT